MDQQFYQIEFAGHCLKYVFHYPTSPKYFRPGICHSERNADFIMATAEQLEIARQLLPSGTKNGFIEFRTLIGLTAKALLQYDCCIFHCVSFVWRGKAFLLTGPSGTGKTTQYLNWNKLFPDDIKIISGDMPVLELREDGSIWAHPSPWNGKENLRSRQFAQVAGIVILKQAQENMVRKPDVQQIILSLFTQFIVRPDTQKQIHTLCRMVDQMIRNVPVLEFRNTGDEASTILLRRTLMGEADDLIQST